MSAEVCAQLCAGVEAAGGLSAGGRGGTGRGGAGRGAGGRVPGRPVQRPVTRKILRKGSFVVQVGVEKIMGRFLFASASILSFFGFGASVTKQIYEMVSLRIDFVFLVQSREGSFLIAAHPVG